MTGVIVLMFKNSRRPRGDGSWRSLSRWLPARSGPAAVSGRGPVGKIGGRGGDGLDLGEPPVVLRAEHHEGIAELGEFGIQYVSFADYQRETR
jgi:hypothetical protein